MTTIDPADRDGLEEQEAAGLDLALDALREPRTVDRHAHAAQGIVTGLLELARRRRQDEDKTPERQRDPAMALSTLDAARADLRDHVLEAVEGLGFATGDDEEAATAAQVLTLAKAYVALGGDLELGRQERAIEAEATLRDVLAGARGIDAALEHVGEHGRALLVEGVLEPLGAALRAFHELRQRVGA